MPETKATCDHVLGLRPRTQRESHFPTMRLEDLRLELHLRLHFDLVEAAEVLIQKLEAGQWVVIPVEKHTAVGRMIIIRMKILELLEIE